MAIQIDCYLSFDGRCEEALNFYAKCLGGKVGTLMRFEGTPMDGKELPPVQPPPSKPDDGVQHVIKPDLQPGRAKGGERPATA